LQNIEEENRNKKNGMKDIGKIVETTEGGLMDYGKGCQGQI